METSRQSTLPVWEATVLKTGRRGPTRSAAARCATGTAAQRSTLCCAQPLNASTMDAACRRLKPSASSAPPRKNDMAGQASRYSVASPSDSGSQLLSAQAPQLTCASTLSECSRFSEMSLSSMRSCLGTCRLDSDRQTQVMDLPFSAIAHHVGHGRKERGC